MYRVSHSAYLDISGVKYGIIIVKIWNHYLLEKQKYSIKSHAAGQISAEKGQELND